MCWLGNLGVERTMTQWLPTVNWFEMSELSWHAIKGKVLGRWECGSVVWKPSSVAYKNRNVFSLRSEGQKQIHVTGLRWGRHGCTPSGGSRIWHSVLCLFWWLPSPPGFCSHHSNLCLRGHLDSFLLVSNLPLRCLCVHLGPTQIFT